MSVTIAKTMSRLPIAALGLCVLSCDAPSSSPSPVSPSETVREDRVSRSAEVEDVIYRGGRERRGSFDGPGLGARAKPAWTVRMLDGKRITGSPLLTREAVYVGTAAGNLAALDPRSGDRLWNFEVERPGLRPAAMWGGTLLLGHDGGLTALDPAAGAVRWRFASDAVRGSPVIVDDVAVVATEGGAVAIDLNVQEQKWGRAFKYGADSSPASDGAAVFLGSERSRLSALSVHDGKLLWNATVEGQVAATPLLTGDGVVVCGVLGRNKPNDPIDGVQAYGSSDGKPRWRFRTQASVSTPLAYSDEVVYFASHAHRVGAIHGRTGELMWSFKAKRSPEPGVLGSGPIVVGDTVYVAMGRTVHALDAHTGARAWKLELDSPVVSALAYRDRTVVVGSYSGAVYALAPAEP